MLEGLKCRLLANIMPHLLDCSWVSNVPKNRPWHTWGTKGPGSATGKNKFGPGFADNFRFSGAHGTPGAPGTDAVRKIGQLTIRISLEDQL